MTTHLSYLPKKSEAGFEELVPSRYALRIGEIDVLVVSDGVLDTHDGALQERGRV